MFTWVCPQCGQEVPPSETECPECARRAAEPKPAPQPATPAHAAAAAPPPARPRPPVVESERIEKKEEDRDLPGWLLAVLFAMGFIALGIGGYYAYKHFTTQAESSTPPIALETPVQAKTEASKANILAKYIEITGIRLIEDSSQRTRVHFLVVNHSGADIADLAGKVSLKPRSAKPDEKPVGEFSFRVPSIGPYESREVSTVLNTSLRAYEIPDWQFLWADVEITSK